MAVTLGAIVILIDLYLDKKIIKSNIIKYIPILIISLVFGIIAIDAQKSGGASDFGKNILNIYSWKDKFLFANYSLFIYLEKLFLPLNLSTLYPYPNKINNLFPTIFYVAPFFNIIFFTIFIYAIIKRIDAIIFGILFFLISIGPVLQIMSIGAAIAADRYFYVSSIGLFFVISYFIVHKLSNNKKILFGVFAVIISILVYLTYERTKVWRTSETLWTDVMKNYPDNELPYWYRGAYYYNQKEMDKVIDDFNNVIRINQNKLEAYTTIASIYKNKGKKQEALKYLNRAIELSPNDYSLYLQRGSIYMDLENYDKTKYDYEKALQLRPDVYSTWMNVGIINSILRNFDVAIKAFNEAVRLSPNTPDVYTNRGNYFDMTNQPEKAIEDYTKGIMFDKNNVDAYSNRAGVYYKLKMYEKALNDYNMVISKLNNNGFAFLRRSLVYQAIGDYMKAKQDIDMAISLGVNVDSNYIAQIESKLKK